MDEMNSIQLTVSKLDVEFDQILVNLKPHVIKLQQQSGQFLSVNSKMLLHVEHGIFVSKRELSPVRLSVCLSVCRLSSVCNARASYSGGSNFRQYFCGIRYLGHPLTSIENFTVIVPGEPFRRGSETQEG